MQIHKKYLEILTFFHDWIFELYHDFKRLKLLTNGTKYAIIDLSSEGWIFERRNTRKPSRSLKQILARRPENGICSMVYGRLGHAGD